MPPIPPGTLLPGERRRGIRRHVPAKGPPIGLGKNKSREPRSTQAIGHRSPITRTIQQHIVCMSQYNIIQATSSQNRRPICAIQLFIELEYYKN